MSGTEADRFGFRARRRFKEPAVVGRSPRASSFFVYTLLPSIYRACVLLDAATDPQGSSPLDASRAESATDKLDKTLSGGSLGSCVDEERSQLREVM